MSDSVDQLGNRKLVTPIIRHSSLAEIFAGHDVRGQLTPILGDFHVFHLKDGAPFGRRDFRKPTLPLDRSPNVMDRFSRMKKVRFEVKALFFGFDSLLIHPKVPNPFNPLNGNGLIFINNSPSILCDLVYTKEQWADLDYGESFPL